jgi:hypothetical protein
MEPARQQGIEHGRKEPKAAFQEGGMKSAIRTPGVRHGCTAAGGRRGSSSSLVSP